MRTYRTSRGPFQLIIEAGFNKEYFGIGFDVTYLDGMKIDKHIIEGFWCLQLDLIALKLTLNITDRKSKQNYKEFEE